MPGVRPGVYAGAGDDVIACLGASGRVSGWIQRGPGWVLGSGVLLTTGLVLLASSVPYGHFGWAMLAALGVLVFGPLWAVRMGACLVWLRVNERFRDNSRRYWRRWVLPAGVAILGVAAWRLELPERLRFALGPAGHGGAGAAGSSRPRRRPGRCGWVGRGLTSSNRSGRAARSF